MKQTKYRLIFTALAAVALLTTSCSKSDIEGNGENPATGKMVSVTLPIDIAESETTANGVADGASRAAAATTTEDGFTVSFGKQIVSSVP